MVDRDSGQRTAALVTTLWRAAWIWRWFVQPAIVWCRGARPRRPPHRHVVCGGGTTANVGEATCAMGWFQCCGSGTKRGRTRVQIRTAWGQGPTEAKEAAMRGQFKRDARAPHRRCAEDPVSLTVAATRIKS